MIDLDAIQNRTLDFQLGGVAYSIPALDALGADEVLDLVNKGTLDRTDVLELFRSILAKHAHGAMDAMTLSQLRALLEAWQETGDAGESVPSSD